MAKDAFQEAGEDLRAELAAKDAARQGTAKLLPGLADFCKQGIGRFYDGKLTDVRVECDSHRLVIEFGKRPGGAPAGNAVQVLHGPAAFIMPRDDGGLGWFQHDGWVEANYLRPTASMEHLTSSDYTCEITKRLIIFLKKAEADYRLSVR